MSTAALLASVRDTDLEIQRVLNDAEQTAGRAWLAEQDAMVKDNAFDTLAEGRVQFGNFVRPMFSVLDQPSENDWFMSDAMRWAPEEVLRAEAEARVHFEVPPGMRSLLPRMSGRYDEQSRSFVLEVAQVIDPALLDLVMGHVAQAVREQD